MMRPKDPDTLNRPQGPHLHRRLRAGRIRILWYLVGQGAAEGLLAAVPALAWLLSLGFQSSPNTLPSPFSGVAVVLICSILGSLRRWYLHREHWAQIWDHCRDRDGLIETLSFLEQGRFAMDEWQRSLCEKAGQIQPPTARRLRNLMAPSGSSPSRGPALIALLLVVGWFLFLAEAASQQLSPANPETPVAQSAESMANTRPAPSESDSIEETGSDMTAASPQEPDSVPEQTSSSGNSPLETSPERQPQGDGNASSLTEDPLSPAETVSENLREFTSESGSGTGLIGSPAGEEASASRLAGSRNEASIRNGPAAAGGQDEADVLTTVPALRNPENPGSPVAGSASGVEIPARDSRLSTKPDPIPVTETRTGPLDYPPHWQKLVDRYMQLRERTPSGAGKR
jgi:hypothetical protein